MTKPVVNNGIKVDLRKDGVLWLINTVVFHPRGFALAVDSETGEFSLLGDGTERWRYEEDKAVESPVYGDEKWVAVERLLRRAILHYDVTRQSRE
jgi:hypothetical protein